jgi:hypothetical protein
MDEDLQSARRPIPGLKPPITKFKSIEGISQEEGEDFIELIRRMRREDLYREPRRESLRLRRFR